MYEVWPEHWDAVKVFEAVAGSQWRWVAGLSKAWRTGLDFNAVDRVMGWRQIPRRRQWAVCEQLLILQDEALLIFQEREQ
ncbi:MAG TPA: DUF1799 domain-containing protein [Ramlibacter sp.]|nr:DUF1799 domain-containing protein [Ramlibacter sp.]